MKLSDFVVREAILVDLQATAKEDAIREIVRSLCQAGRLAETDLESVSARHPRPRGARLNRDRPGCGGPAYQAPDR